MKTPVPDKIARIMEQTIQMVLPVALKAAGPVMVTFGRTDNDLPADKPAIFSEQFRDSMQELFAKLGEKPAPQEKAAARKVTSTQDDLEERISKYSLMDTDLLEAQLAAERLSSSLEKEFQFPVDSLSMRLEKLLGFPFERGKNPLQAKHLTMVFRQSCDKLLPSKTASDTAMKNWAEALQKNYAGWLETLNQSLVQQRILPQLSKEDVHKRYEKKDQEKAREMRKNLISEITGKPADSAGDVSEDDLMQGIYNMLTQAITKQPGITKHIVQGAAHGPKANKDEVLEALRQITKQVTTNEETGYREQLETEKTLAEKILTATDLQSKALDSQTQNSISLLSMMFDRLQQEEQIAAPMKTLIDDLQVPILKLAIKDSQFFSNPDNPAQELVNEIAKAGTHWTPKENVSKDPFYRKISGIVSDITTAPEEDEGLFEEKLETLKEFLEKEERRAALLEERIIHAESARARTEAARSTAEHFIQQQIVQHPAKPHTTRFLREYWAQVLFFYLNRDDDDGSPEQDHAVSLMQTLLGDGTQTHGPDTEELFRDITGHLHAIGQESADVDNLLANVRQELEETLAQALSVRAAAEAAEAQARLETQTATLAHATVQALDSEQTPDRQPAATTEEPVARPPDEIPATAQKQADDNGIAFEGFTQQKPEPVVPPAEKPLPPPPRIIPPVKTAEQTAAQDEFDIQAARMSANSWLRMNTDNDSKIKVKLAAIIKHNGSYIFVNREGVKVLTTDQPGVANRLRSGEMTLVDDAVFFDRALESVIHSLRQ